MPQTAFSEAFAQIVQNKDELFYSQVDTVLIGAVKTAPQTKYYKNSVEEAASVKNSQWQADCIDRDAVLDVMYKTSQSDSINADVAKVVYTVLANSKHRDPKQPSLPFMGTHRYSMPGGMTDASVKRAQEQKTKEDALWKTFRESLAEIKGTQEAVKKSSSVKLKAA